MTRYDDCGFTHFFGKLHMSQLRMIKCKSDMNETTRDMDSWMIILMKQSWKIKVQMHDWWGTPHFGKTSTNYCAKVQHVYNLWSFDSIPWGNEAHIYPLSWGLAILWLATPITKSVQYNLPSYCCCWFILSWDSHVLEDQRSTIGISHNFAPSGFQSCIVVSDSPKHLILRLSSSRSSEPDFSTFSLSKLTSKPWTLK